jgi:hypothetical protein
LYHDELLCVSKGFAQLQILQAKYNTLVVNHGFNKTMELVSHDYWWLQLWKFVKEFVGLCDVFACAKNPHHCPHGLLQPLPILTSPWSSISMDFIMDLPLSNSFESILMVLDRLMKMVHFIPCNKSITYEKRVKLFCDHVFHYHGLQFASKF